VSQSCAAIGLAVVALGAEDESAPARSVPVWDLRDSDERLHAAFSLVRRFPLVETRRRVTEDEQEESLPEARRRSVHLARDKQTASRQRTPPVDIEQIFLRDMRSIPMLNREEEIRLAREIAEKRRVLVELVFSSKPARQHLLTLRTALETTVQAAGADDDQLADESGNGDEAGPAVASANLNAESLIVEARPDASFENPGRTQELLNAACTLIESGQCETDAHDGGVGARGALCKTLNEIPLEVADAKRAFLEFKRRRAQFVARELPNHDASLKGSELAVEMERELGMTSAEADSHERRFAVIEWEIEGLCARLLTSNLRLVAHNARRYARRNHHVATQLLDLIQGGTFGLMRAVERFDPERGYKFSTYATWWIRQGITRTLANDGRTIRIPVHLKEQMHKVRKAFRALDRGEDGVAEAGDVARYLGIPLARVERLRTLGLSIRSLDSPDVLGEPLVERVPSQLMDPEQRLLVADLSSRVRTALSRLDARKQLVLRRRYGVGVSYPETLEEIAADFGLTRERIRQIESDAEADLQRILTERFAAEHGLRIHPTDNAVARQQKRRKAASVAASGQLALQGRGFA
jgi:RNA polymerase primary sigma factor